MCVRDWQSERRVRESSARVYDKRVRERRKEREKETEGGRGSVCVIEISFSRTFHRFPPTFFVTIKRPNRSQSITLAHFIYTCGYPTLDSRHMTDFDTQYYDKKQSNLCSTTAHGTPNLWPLLTSGRCSGVGVIKI